MTMNKIIFPLLVLLLVSCKKDDDCQATCPTGYTGCDCATLLVPTSVTITRVQLLQYPATNSGKPWDDFSQFADPYFTIVYSGSGVTVFTSSFLEELPPTSVGDWAVNVDLFGFAKGPYSMFIEDYDSSGTDTRITAISINPYTIGQPLPPLKEFIQNGAIVKIYYEYQY